jgi:hypothetical protein
MCRIGINITNNIQKIDHRKIHLTILLVFLLTNWHIGRANIVSKFDSTFVLLFVKWILPGYLPQLFPCLPRLRYFHDHFQFSEQPMSSNSSYPVPNNSISMSCRFRRRWGRGSAVSAKINLGDAHLETRGSRQGVVVHVDCTRTQGDLCDIDRENEPTMERHFDLTSGALRPLSSPVRCKVTPPPAGRVLTRRSSHRASYCW